MPSAKSLILDLLSTVARGSVPVRALVRAAALFGLGENPIRVALARLRAEGLVASDERGLYRLGERARAVQSQVVSWRRIEERVRPWGGGWIGVHTAPLGRSDRPLLRRRHRALAFLGFRTLQAGLEVRPDNLSADLAETRGQLRALGLERDALVCGLGQLDEDHEERARALWDIDALLRSYREVTLELIASASALPSLPREQALVRSFLLGGRAIRQLVFDPLLPAEILPPDDRARLVAELQAYDVLGRRCWSGMLEVVDARASDPESAPADVRGLESIAALAPAGGV